MPTWSGETGHYYPGVANIRDFAAPPVCSNIVINGRFYYHCGGAYYQPRYDGTDVVYVVVDNPN